MAELTPMPEAQKRVEAMNRNAKRFYAWIETKYSREHECFMHSIDILDMRTPSGFGMHRIVCSLNGSSSAGVITRQLDDAERIISAVDLAERQPSLEPVE